MSRVPAIEIRVHPPDCDPRGHATQEAFLGMFERARWDAFARGPGVDLFARSRAWPVVRKATIEYYAEAAPGTVLQFDTTLTHHGRTSFTFHQTARRATDQVLVAEADFVFVCLGDDGSPRAVPGEIRQYFGARPSVRAGVVQHVVVGALATAVDIQGDGVPVLFVHGFPLDRTMWRYLIAPLTGRRRIAPDLRGFGLSDAPESGYSIAQYADDMIALLDTLKVERAVVCGLSMGGYVVLDMVRRYRQRLLGLVLMNTRADADSAEQKARREEMSQLVERQGVAAIADALIPKLLAPTSLTTMPAVVERLRSMIIGNPTAGVIGALTAMQNRPDATDLLAGIDLPTLVVTGREDQLIPPDQAKTMADQIPGAHFTVIAGAGHLTPMEQPTPTSRVIAEFLDSLV